MQIVIEYDVEVQQRKCSKVLAVLIIDNILRVYV
jgi:hypothetical protein